MMEPKVDDEHDEPPPLGPRVTSTPLMVPVVTRENRRSSTFLKQCKQRFSWSKTPSPLADSRRRDDDSTDTPKRISRKRAFSLSLPLLSNLTRGTPSPTPEGEEDSKGEESKQGGKQVMDNEPNANNRNKREGEFIIDRTVASWRDDVIHGLHISKCCKISVPFNYFNIIRHHFVVMEVSDGRKQIIGYLVTQILSTGDVTLYSFSDFEKANKNGRSAASILGKLPQKESTMIEEWVKPYEYTSVLDIYEFIATHIDNKYHILKNNCIVVADLVFKYLTEPRLKYFYDNKNKDEHKSQISNSSDTLSADTKKRKRSSDMWYSKSMFKTSKSTSNRF